MTEIERIDEAIEYLTEMARYGMPDVKCASIFELALTALREKRERERMKLEQPLTIGELIDRIDEYLWVKNLTTGEDWRMRLLDIATERRPDGDTWFRFDGKSAAQRLSHKDYNKTWLAYAHRPGGVEG